MKCILKNEEKFENLQESWNVDTQMLRLQCMYLLKIKSKFKYETWIRLKICKTLIQTNTINNEILILIKNIQKHNYKQATLYNMMKPITGWSTYRDWKNLSLANILMNPTEQFHAVSSLTTLPIPTKKSIVSFPALYPKFLKNKPRLIWVLVGK